MGIMRAIVELRDKIRKEWDESECFDIVPYPILNDERAIDKIEYLKGEISSRDEEIENLKKEYEGRIQSLLAQIEEKEEIIKKAETQGFDIESDEDGDGSQYDSADVDSESDDMPPLIDEHQQTVFNITDDQMHTEDVMVSEITERNSIINKENNDEDGGDDNVENKENENGDDDENKDEENYEIIDVDENTENKTRSDRTKS